MKKSFLLTLMMMLAGITFAQTGTKEDPLAAHPGECKCSHAPDYDYHTCWWKYTPTRDGVFYATPFDGMYISAENADGYSVTGADLANYGKAYYVKADQPIFIKISGDGAVGFNADYETCSDTGLDPETPAWLIDNVRTYLGNPDASEMTTTYAQFMAFQEGVLQLRCKGYVAYCSVNDGPETSFTYSGEYGYVYNLKVKGGETYKFKFRNYNPFVINTVMTYPEKGSLDNPFEMAYGENTVPAAAGKYYYTFAQPDNRGGNAYITSDATLPEGQVVVYKNASNIDYDIVYEKSEKGSFNVNFETIVLSTPATYYIMVDKKTATDTEDKFNFNWERYAEGSDRDNPHVVTLGDTPLNLTTDDAFTPVYYKFDVPAGKAWKVMASATPPYDPSTTVRLYDSGNSSNYNEGPGSALIDCLGGEEGRTFFVMWNADAPQAVNFMLMKKEIPAGDVAGYPLEAVLGTNNIAAKGTGTKFYTYTATRSGKLNVEVTGNMTVSFLKGPGQYDGVYEFVKNGNNFYLDGQEGQLYYIKVENIADGDSFTITEGDYGVGESRETAVEVKDGAYTINNAPVNTYWIKYTVQKPVCKLAIEGNMIAEGGSAMSYVKASEYWTTDMKVNEFDASVGATVYKFRGALKAKAGEEVLVCFSMPDAKYNGKQIKFTEFDYKLGEDVTTAIPLNVGNVTIPVATAEAPVWLKVNLKEGDFKMVAHKYYTGTWYTDLDRVESGWGERLNITRPGSAADYITTYSIAQNGAYTPGEYYIAITGSEGGTTTFEVSGSAVEDEVIPFPHRKMYGFFLRNNAIEGYGVYSMYMDDMANAEMINRYDLTYPTNSIGAFCGAVVDDIWYGCNYVYSFSGPPLPGGFVAINLLNGKASYIGEWAAADEDGLRFQDMSYDYSNKIMYGIGFNAGVSALYTFDLTTGKPTFVTSLGIEEYGKKVDKTLGTLAADLEGNLYGVAHDGWIYSVNKETGILTPVFNTGYDRLPGNQSMEFDRTTGLLYWSSFTYGKDNADESWLIAIDLKNQKMYDENNKIGEQANLEGLYIPFVAAGPKAAEAPADFKVTAAAQGVKKAELSWTTPSMTFDGRGYIGEIQKLTIERNGKVIKEYEGVKPSTFMTYNDDAITADGMYKYIVYATTEVGIGKESVAYEYVGVDYPTEIAEVSVANQPGCAAVDLKWEAPAEGHNNGYFSPDGIRYRVTRYPDRTVVAEGLEKPEYTDSKIGRLARYYYGVSAYNDMGESQRTLTDYIVSGPSKTCPVIEDLVDWTAFQNTWTTVDGNKDLYTWFRLSGMDTYMFGDGVIALEYLINPTYTPPTMTNNADEWVITPPIGFEGDKDYQISFQTRNITDETLEVHTATTNAVKDMTLAQEIALGPSPEDPDGTPLVTTIVKLPKLDGVNCVGVRLTSPITPLRDPNNPETRLQAYFEITNFVICEVPVVDAIDNVNAAGSDISVALGTDVIRISGQFDSAVLYDAAGRQVATASGNTVNAKALGGNVGMLVVKQGKDSKVFKVKF